MSWRGVVVFGLVAAGALGWWATRRSDAPPATDGPGPASAPERPPAEERTRRPADAEPAPGRPAAHSPAYEWNERGIRALASGALADAVAAFERCAELAPDEPVYRTNLAEALARRARAVRDEEVSLGAALPLLARAVELAPDRADLAALHARWSREAEVEEEFSQFHSPYFELSFDGERTELLLASQRFLDRLEEAYTDLQEWFAHDPILAGRPPFPVRLYRRDEFDDLTGLGHWAAGAFDGTIRLPLEEEAVGPERWSRTLRHELVHAFVAEVGGTAVPAWLNEGLAQWLEGDPALGLAAARGRLRGGEPVPLADLRASLTTLRDPEQLRRAYDQSFALVAHLARDYGAPLLLDLVRTPGDRAAIFADLTGVPLTTVLGDLYESL